MPKGVAILFGVTSKLQITLPTLVLDAMDVGPSDRFELLRHPTASFCDHGASTIAHEATAGKELSRQPPLDIRRFRVQPCNPALRQQVHRRT